jgi:enamine deaminase RidA (YjgF/YER057c/UK114 family)
MEWHYDQWHLSPLVLHEGLGFISGVTGTRDDGSCAEDPAVEFAEAFDKLGHVLHAGNLSLADIIEMTTFHVGLQAHIDVFQQVRDRYLSEPWPAWSAIGTTELAVPGPRLEIKVICRRAR